MVAWSVPKPMYSANVQSWTEILLTGTPCPVQSGGAAAAVPAVPRPMHAAASSGSEATQNHESPPLEASAFRRRGLSKIERDVLNY